MGVLPFPQSETTTTKTTTRLLQFTLETVIQNNLGTFQGETGALGVPESKRKPNPMWKYKKGSFENDSSHPDGKMPLKETIFIICLKMIPELTTSSQGHMF